MTDDLVKIFIRFKEGDDLPAGESMWARPLDVDEGGGHYELENSSFFVPLAAGDVVEARLDGHSRLQLTDIVRPSGSVVTLFQPGVQDQAALEALVGRWSEAGAHWTEGNPVVLTTVWAVGMDLDAVGRALVEAGSPQLGSWVGALEPHDRSREVHDEIEFDLDTTPRLPVVETDYWVGDDPWWAEQGFDDPALLARVQQLAGEDARVARALERGQQDRVLTYLERLSSPDPASLPPLEKPLFDD